MMCVSTDALTSIHTYAMLHRFYLMIRVALHGIIVLWGFKINKILGFLPLSMLTCCLHSYRFHTMFCSGH